eukprot:1180984-Prorocentrum_minimum.AAC.3
MLMVCGWGGRCERASPRATPTWWWCTLCGRWCPTRTTSSINSSSDGGSCHIAALRSGDQSDAGSVGIFRYVMFDGVGRGGGGGRQTRAGFRGVSMTSFYHL